MEGCPVTDTEGTDFQINDAELDDQGLPEIVDVF